MKSLFSAFKLIAALVATAAAFALVSCNTVSGLGEDIGNAGSSIERAAQ